MSDRDVAVGGGEANLAALTPRPMPHASPCRQQQKKKKKKRKEEEVKRKDGRWEKGTQGVLAARIPMKS
jgi:hypothetical protein